MPERVEKGIINGLRIGAVSYLNARPLTAALAELVPEAKLIVDYPSRLAEQLAANQLDVAMIPSIEYARHPGYTIVSDACIACDGPVRSVKLFGRVPVEDIETLALDEGSRTSAALSQILLKEQFGLTPKLQPLSMGDGLEATTADAVLLIGDRGMSPVPGRFEFVWDLGEQWHRWTGLPFVFAMWIARADLATPGLARLLSVARDLGLQRLPEIAQHEAPLVRLPKEDCLSYLRDHLEFHLGERQRQGLQRYYTLAAHHGLAPTGVTLDFYTV